MSVYYRPGLRTYRDYRGYHGLGLTALDSMQQAAGGGFTPTPSTGMIAMEAIPLSPDRGGYDEFTGTHRAPAAVPAAFTALYTTAFQQAMTAGSLSSKTDAIQQMVKSGQLQIQTWAGYKAACEAAGGTPKSQADGSMTCAGAAAEMTMAGGGLKPGNAPGDLTGGSIFGGKSGSGSGSGGNVAGAAFDATCKTLGGTYYSTGPCCDFGSQGGYVGLDAKGAPIALASCGGAGVGAGAASGGAGVAVLGGVALLALMLLR